MSYTMHLSVALAAFQGSTPARADVKVNTK